MKKPTLILISLLILIIILIIVLSFTKGGYAERIIDEIKARGIMEYTAAEAVEMAINKCTQCHTLDNIKKYCDRCGPPFIVVVHQMKKYAIPQWRQKYPKSRISDITDFQAATIVQVWNSSIGNWEKGWRKEDLEKLLEGDQPLLRLLNTPAEDRKIERALSKEEMSPAEKYQREMMGVNPGSHEDHSGQDHEEHQ